MSVILFKSLCGVVGSFRSTEETSELSSSASIVGNSDCVWCRVAFSYSSLGRDLPQAPVPLSLSCWFMSENIDIMLNSRISFGFSFLVITSSAILSLS